MHHSYVYEGPISLLPQLADSAIELFSFERGYNPDVQVRSWEKFGIDESRELTMSSSLRSTSGKMLFILGMSSISSQAQQALLKLFEEPQAGVIFVLLMPHGMMLSTLRSRFLEYPKNIFSVKYVEDFGNVAESDSLRFLASSYKERSDWIFAFLKNEEWVRERVRNFLNELERVLYAKIADKDCRKGLEDIAHFRQYLADQSPSLKMILEHLAATLPQISG